MWVGLLAVLAVIPFLVAWSSLPDPVATHWGPGGDPDGTMAKQWVWLLPVSVCVFGLVLAGLLRRGDSPSAEGMVLSGFMGGIGIWVGISTVALNRDAVTWEEAGSFGWWQIVGLLATGVLFGWIGLLLGRRWYPTPPAAVTSAAPAIELVHGERAVWVGSARVSWPLIVFLPLAVALLFLPGWLVWLAPLYLILAFGFARVGVVVDDYGLRVKLGGLLTVRRIGLDKVMSARPIDLEPAEWGGWGYRMIPGGTSVVLRRGDAIEVTLTNDRKFAVTVDDAATGAALLNGLVARAARA